MTEREARERYRDYAMRLLFLDFEKFKTMSFDAWVENHKITLQK
jgi:hypothetical protein